MKRLIFHRPIKFIPVALWVLPRKVADAGQAHKKIKVILHVVQDMHIMCDDLHSSTVVSVSIRGNDAHCLGCFLGLWCSCAFKMFGTD